MTKLIIKNFIEGAASIEEAMANIFAVQDHDMERRKSLLEYRCKEYQKEKKVDATTALKKVVFWRLTGQILTFAFAMTSLLLVLFLCQNKNANEVALISILMVGYCPLWLAPLLCLKYKQIISSP